MEALGAGLELTGSRGVIRGERAQKIHTTREYVYVTPKHPVYYSTGTVKGLHHLEATPPPLGLTAPVQRERERG